MRKQRGWAGMIVILIALAIVAWLSKDLFKKMGLLPPDETAVTRPATPSERARMPAGGAVEQVDPTTVTPTPRNAIERARGVEGTLKEQAEKRGGD